MREDLARSRLMPGILIMSLALTAMSVAVGSPRLFWPGVLATGLGVVDSIWQLRTAPVTLTPASVILRPAFLRPRHEVAWSEISSWVATKKLLGIRTIGGKTVRLSLVQLRPGSRARLLEQLATLVLPHGATDPITARSLRRSYWTQFALALCLTFAIAAVFLAFSPAA